MWVPKITQLKFFTEQILRFYVHLMYRLDFSGVWGLTWCCDIKPGRSVGVSLHPLPPSIPAGREENERHQQSQEGTGCSQVSGVSSDGQRGPHRWLAQDPRSLPGLMSLSLTSSLILKSTQMIKKASFTVEPLIMNSHISEKTNYSYVLLHTLQC